MKKWIFTDGFPPVAIFSVIGLFVSFLAIYELGAWFWKVMSVCGECTFRATAEVLAGPLRKKTVPKHPTPINEHR